MYTIAQKFLYGLTAASLGLAGMVAVAGPADASGGKATIVQADPESSCAGERATLSWAPPADVVHLTGYQVLHQHYSKSTPTFRTTEVGAEQTSLAFTIPFGLSVFLITAITSDGVQPEPFASATVRGNRAPFAMNWDNGENDGVGDRTATVTYKWYGPVTESTTGGSLPVTVRITASPGEASIDVPTAGSSSVTTTFSGLINGVEYTFSAVTFNACGTSEARSSATFTPGVAPVWVRSAPPLTAGPGAYVYNFTATGEPAPTYELRDAPSWLQVSAKGLVRGRPPEGTESFSYSVVARNGVGIEPFDMKDVVAGPFTVSVRSPHK